MLKLDPKNSYWIASLVLGALEVGLGVGPVDQLHVLPRAPGLPAFADIPQFDDDVKVGVDPWNDEVENLI